MRLQRIVLAAGLAILLACPAAAQVFTKIPDSCPANTRGLKKAHNVGAVITRGSHGGSISVLPAHAYYFTSTNENPVDGVPGLVQYCVLAKSYDKFIGVFAVGADGEHWALSLTSTGFSFARPDGDASNIPLDGIRTYMGYIAITNATTIILQIHDPEECTHLYGRANRGTCFVLPD